MVWFKRSSRFTRLAIILAVALALELAVDVPARVQAQLRPSTLQEKLPNQWEFSPPSAPTDPLPTRREGAATRGDDQACIQGSDLLTALVPASGMGETAAEYPTFSWYMPKTSASAVEFVLRDAKGSEIYRSFYALTSFVNPSSNGLSQGYTLPLRNGDLERNTRLFDPASPPNVPNPSLSETLRSTLRASRLANLRTVNLSEQEPTTDVVSTSRIMSLTLPPFANLSPLEIGQEYFWTLALVCDPSERSKDIIAEGALKRVKPDSTLALRIQQATPEERVALYANARLWYETLNTLVDLRRDRPNNNDLTQAWEKLLKSVGLDAISKKLGS